MSCTLRRFIDVEALIQEVSLVLALKQLQNVPKTAVITEAIGNICENVITFYEGIDQIGVSVRIAYCTIPTCQHYAFCLITF